MLVSSVPLSESHRRTTTNCSERVELVHYPQGGQRGIGDERQTLAREVVDDRQNAKAAAVIQCVRCEVEAPTLIGALGDCDWRPRAESPLAARAPAHLQPLLAVEPAQLLVVHEQVL